MSTVWFNPYGGHCFVWFRNSKDGHVSVSSVQVGDLTSSSLLHWVWHALEHLQWVNELVQRLPGVGCGSGYTGCLDLSGWWQRRCLRSEWYQRTGYIKLLLPSFVQRQIQSSCVVHSALCKMPLMQCMSSYMANKCIFSPDLKTSTLEIWDGQLVSAMPLDRRQKMPNDWACCGNVIGDQLMAVSRLGICCAHLEECSRIIDMRYLTKQMSFLSPKHTTAKEQQSESKMQPS